MGKKKDETSEAGASAEQSQVSETQVASQQGTQPSPPQGIVIRYMDTGDPKRDLHPYRRDKRMIDPASLVVDGKPPVLSMPIQGSSKRRCKRIASDHAALLLTCDWATGNQPAERLATDEEVAELEREDEYRRSHGGKNPEPENV